MKVFFVIPRNKSMFGDQKSPPPYPHVGIAYLIAVLKQNKVSVKVYDEGIEKDDHNLKELIENFKPTIIGVTGFSYAYSYLYDLIKKIKSFSKIPVIVGGPHVAATEKEIISETSADFALLGEAEETLPIFLKEYIKDNPNYSNVPGLIWRKGKKIISNGSPVLIKNLDKLPFPDYEAFPLGKYPCFAEKLLPLLTSRGCPYSCNYCSVRLLMGYRFRPRSPENVISEIKYWYKRGFRSFDINDDCFTLNLSRAESICELIIRNELKIKFQLYNGIRVDKVSLSLLHKLKKAGCSFVAYGCEAGNEEVLKNIGKNITLRQVRQAVDWTNKAGIKNAVNFIVGHKGETYTQALDSLKFAKSLPTNFVNFYNLVPYPGTEVYNWATKYAHFLVPKETFLKLISYRDNSPIFETKEFTKEQRKEIMRKGFALYERKVLQFRLGKPFGTLLFYFTRLKLLSRIARWFVGNKYGMRVYQHLIVRSKE